VILLPAATWHKVVNIGEAALEVYELYALPEDAHGTVHPTKADSDSAEHP
jgi:mannose-6-phosphate isomerase-like protein (cupin superfamily)